MGRSSKPLSFLVTDQAMLEWPEVVALREKGHTVDYSPLLSPSWNAIIGPNCWMMNEALRKFFPSMVQGVRDAKYNRGKAGLHEPKNEALASPAPADGGDSEDDDEPTS